MQARSAVQCRSARVNEAVSPAKSARVAIGLIVVKRVAKSLLILINRGDMVDLRWRFKQTADQRPDKATVGHSWMERMSIFIRCNGLTIQRFTRRKPLDQSSSVRCEIEHKNAPGSGSCADSWYFASGLRA